MQSFYNWGQMVFTTDQMDALLGAFSNADIYLVNTRVPRSWEAKVNEALLQKHRNMSELHSLIGMQQQSITLNILP